MSPEQRFKFAAWTYFVYGIIYLAGAIYLVQQGIGPRGREGADAGVAWFILGALFVVVFPWLIARGARGPAYLWFVRILTLFVAWRAYEVGRIALHPRTSHVPAPWGGQVPMAAGAWVFFVITLATMTILSWASWRRQ